MIKLIKRYFQRRKTKKLVKKYVKETIYSITDFRDHVRLNKLLRYKEERNNGNN